MRCTAETPGTEAWTMELDYQKRTKSRLRTTARRHQLYPAMIPAKKRNWRENSSTKVTPKTKSTMSARGLPRGQ
eukprot:5675786-Amphidinium_carterae.1